MKNILVIAVSLICCSSCFDQSNQAKAKSSSTLHMTAPSSDSSLNKNEEQQRLSIRYLGIYTGLQPGYNLRNANGEEMEVRGEKVPVPPCEYKFIFKQDNEVALQQINLENNQRILYKGHYTIVEEDDYKFTLSCTVNDGGDSSPNYTIEINKQDKTMMCFGSNEPAFHLNYGNEVITSSSTKPAEATPADSVSGQ